MKKVWLPLSLVALLSACAAYAPGPVGTAQLAGTKGDAVSGSGRFEQMGDKVRVSGEVQGLAPNRVHGFHVHEKGDCSSGDGMGTGGHFNPGSTAHGAHDADAHHAGDLASLKADANGVARFSYDAQGIYVDAGAASVVGRGLIVHRDPDDYKTQPTGNSGPRVACAVIQKI